MVKLCVTGNLLTLSHLLGFLFLLNFNGCRGCCPHQPPRTAAAALLPFPCQLPLEPKWGIK